MPFGQWSERLAEYAQSDEVRQELGYWLQMSGDGFVKVHEVLLKSGKVPHIFSKDILQQIQNGEDGWESMVPDKVAKLVKDKCLFGYPIEKMEFEY